MKIRIKFLLIMHLLMILSSCNNDIDNVIIQGTVKDINTKKPIKDIVVTLICWKYGDSPDASYSEEEVIKVKTNSKGKYTHTFDKGAYIEVKILHPKYKLVHEASEIYTKKNTFNLLLKLK